VIPFFYHHEEPAKTPVPSEEFQESIKPFQHETNITEGSEFLDDGIRTEDQPFEEVPMKEDKEARFQTKKNQRYDLF